jgi:hypothetical protein
MACGHANLVATPHGIYRLSRRQAGIRPLMIGAIGFAICTVSLNPVMKHFPWERGRPARSFKLQRGGNS